MISRNLLPGWFRKAIRVTNFVKSFGPIKWVIVVDFIVIFLLLLLVLVFVASERPERSHTICYPDGFLKPPG